MMTYITDDPVADHARWERSQAYDGFIAELVRNGMHQCNEPETFDAYWEGFAASPAYDYSERELWMGRKLLENSLALPGDMEADFTDYLTRHFTDMYACSED